MSHCETCGWGKCAHCGGSVAVKANRGGKAYYRCDHCGIEVRHHWQKTSDKVLQQFAAPAEPAAPAAVAVKSGESPPVPAVKKRSTLADQLGI